eukprot:1150138-Pelagomonas_calceolata.AAC.4
MKAGEKQHKERKTALTWRVFTSLAKFCRFSLNRTLPKKVSMFISLKVSTTRATPSFLLSSQSMRGLPFPSPYRIARTAPFVLLRSQFEKEVCSALCKT